MVQVADGAVAREQSALRVSKVTSFLNRFGAPPPRRGGGGQRGGLAPQIGFAFTRGRTGSGLGFGNHLNHFPVECRNVIRLTAGHQLTIADHLLIHPLGAGVCQIRFKRGP